MVTLRNYQVNLNQQIQDSTAKGNTNIIAVLPTGGGKTSVACDYIFNAVKLGKSVLFIAHRKELIEQAHARLSQFGVQAGLIMGSKHKYKGDSVNIASVQTLVNREFPKADIVFIDEAHHFVLKGAKVKSTAAKVSESETVSYSFGGTCTTIGEAPEVIENKPEWLPSAYSKVFEHYNKKALLIGLTATPKRLDGQALGDVFEDMVFAEVDGEIVDIGWLQEEGFLVRARYFGAPIEVDTEGLKVTASGDFNEKQLFEKINNKVHYDGVVENYLKHNTGHKAAGLKGNLKNLVFCVNVEHCKNTTEAFLAAGVKADYVTGCMDNAEREFKFKCFKDQLIDVLCNVGIATEGFDDPSIAAITADRCTDSESLFLQMIGRALRPVYAAGYDLETKGGRLAAIAASNKPYALVLDHGTNCKRLGFAEDAREYSLEGKKKDKAGVAPVRECPTCFLLMPVQKTVCPDCEYAFTVEKKAPGKVEFVELKPTEKPAIPAHLKKQFRDMSAAEFAELRELKKLPAAWVVKQFEVIAFRERDFDARRLKMETLLTEFAELETATKKPYKSSWVHVNLSKFVNFLYSKN